MIKTHTCLFISLLFFFVTGCQKAQVDPADQLLQEMADSMNESKSSYQDFLTVFDSCAILPNKTLCYYFTLNVNIIRIDTTAIKTTLKELDTYYFMTDSEFDQLKEHGINYQCVYRSSVGKTLLDFTISPDFYLNRKSDYQDEVSDTKIYEFLKIVADFYNATLPREMSEGYNLARIDLKYPRTLIYRYSLDGVKATDAPFEDLYDAEGYESLMVNSLRTTDYMNLFKNQNVIFNYIVTDENDVEMYSITITPDEYNKPPEEEKSEIRIAVDNWKNRDKETSDTDA